MKKILIISLLITCLVMVGCGEVEQEPIIDIDYNDLGVIESDDDCPDHLEECKKQLEEVDAFEYEFECDKWEKTGITYTKMAIVNIIKYMKMVIGMFCLVLLILKMVNIL